MGEGAGGGMRTERVRGMIKVGDRDGVSISEKEEIKEEERGETVGKGGERKREEWCYCPLVTFVSTIIETVAVTYPQEGEMGKQEEREREKKGERVISIGHFGFGAKFNCRKRLELYLCNR